MLKNKLTFNIVMISGLIIFLIFLVAIIVLIKTDVFTDMNTKLLNSDRTISNILSPSYIPDGFSYAEGDINNGYVIKDNNGNEFVWVPVDNNKIKLQRFNFNKQKDFKNYFDNVPQFISSVEKYGGFYVARYESGNENNKVVSKKNVNVWNNITYEDALNLSKNMYNSSVSGIYSNLINSYAWDTIMIWTSNIPNINSENVSYLYNSRDMGNYSNKISVTGSSEAYKIKNIYDIAGNVAEFTTEQMNYHEKNIHISRGGMYSITPETLKIVDRIPNYNDKYETAGFRIILYK